MKRIILSLLTIVLLFSCQSEEDIVPDFTNQNKYPFTRSGGASTLFERLFDNYKTHPAYSEQEYRLWIHKISVYTIGRSPEVYSVIEEKFNLWAKNWDSYQDKKCSETFKPLLLYYIAENN